MANYEVPHWCQPVTIGLTIMNEGILLPIMIYYAHKIWKLRHEVFFAKRRPKLIVTSMICMGFNPVLRPLRLYAFWYGTEPLWIEMMYFWPYALAFSIAFLRFWLTLYDFKYNEEICNNKMNKNDDSNDLSFWIQNKSHLGTYKGCLMTVIVVFGTYLIIASYLRTVSQTYALFFQFTYLGFLAVFTILIERQVTVYRDAFYITEEFRIARISAIICILLWFVAVIISSLFAPLSSIIATILSFICTSVGMSLYNVICIRWAINKYHHVYEKLNVIQHEQNSKNAKEITINQCIEHNEGYYLFLQYLIEEFAVVNLEFVTDAIYIKHKFATNESDSCYDKSANFEWPNIPQNMHLSSIMKYDHFYNAAVGINEMYIKQGAYFEINTSHELQAEIEAQIQTEQCLDIDIFDKCIEETLCVLHDAYNRFKCTEKYQKFTDSINNV